jgi:ankyrin repeat protein
VNVLISARADVNSTRGNYTPLSYATARNNIDIIKILLDAGADVHLAPDNGSAPIFEALNSPDTLRFLLAAKADPDARNQKGETALGIAIQRGAEAIVEILLLSGANPRLKTASGQTPLALAVALDENEIVETLKANGALK